MEGKALYSNHSASSSTSAIDLTGTTAGLASPRPPSPSLEPTTGLSRRRQSWARVEDLQDPLHFDLSAAFGNPSTASVGDDPFYIEERTLSYSNMQPHYEDPHEANAYSTNQAGPSSLALISQLNSDGMRDDDEAHLTSNMSHAPNGHEWIQTDDDTERIAGSTPRSRRPRTVQYKKTSPSPQKSGNAFKSISRNIRRMSLRVVNLAGSGLENQIRLEDEDSDEEVKHAVGKGRSMDSGEWKEEVLDLRVSMRLRGRSLGFMGPDNRIRMALLDFLVYPWTEPFILFLIVINAVVLTLQASRSITLPSSTGDHKPPRVKGYFHSWEDYVLFFLFILFTLEALARICVSGFLLDPEIPISAIFLSPFSSQPDSASSSMAVGSSNAARFTSDRSQGVLSRGLTLTQRIRRLNENLKRPYKLNDRVPPSVSTNGTVGAGRSRSDTIQSTTPINEKYKLDTPSFSLSTPQRGDNILSLPFKLSIAQAHAKTQRNVPYLRHSWSRIDFVAIVSFWVTFVLATTGVERGASHIGLFRAMSVIRTARLLAITSGTTTIMHSLKTARPLLTSVAYFVLFAMVLFSIIGTQSFKGSFRRQCYVNAVLGEQDIQLTQTCGGYVDPTSRKAVGYVMKAGGNALTPKGYICPLGQTCKEADNPQNNVESFDTIYNSALQVVIVSSANGWAALMYSMVDSEFFVSCFFFIFCIVVLNFWLINLFVAVITNTFGAIHSDTKKSAFGAAPASSVLLENDDGWSAEDGPQAAKKNWIKIIYDYSKWCWVSLALASLVLQATKTVDMTSLHQSLLDTGELVITLAFDVEIVVRVLSVLPDWRSFFLYGNNRLDLVLAIGTTIIQIPVIHQSSYYPWFTILQLTRFYRVILEVPRMRPLLLAVFGDMYGLVNMTLFLILVNFIAALAAVQFLRGDFGADQAMNFGQIYVAFLAMYQIFSSENWTTVLYSASTAETQLGQTVVAILFISAWLLFANFIVLQMYIAVINENFAIAEESKRGQQASEYWATQKPDDAAQWAWFRKLNPYRWVKANPDKVKVENLPSNLVLPMRKNLVQDHAIRMPESRQRIKKSVAGTVRGLKHYPLKSLNALQRIFAGDPHSNDFQLSTIRHARQETLGTSVQNEVDEEIERQLDLIDAVNPEPPINQDINDILYERRAQKADFIRDHSTYDQSFWIFSQSSILRRLCQKVVEPAGGERIFGSPPSPIAHPLFQLFISLSIFAAIGVENIATPLYRREFYAEHGFKQGTWFDLAELTFGLTLVLEFAIKIIADGFIFTPNAYVRSIWNTFDLFILLGILVNLSTGLFVIGGLNRFTRSLKALRVLRFITLIEKMRTTFESLIFSGALRILDAAMLAILYMIPYAVWGLNIFSGLMNQCNDSTASGESDCIGEFSNSVIQNSFGFLTPRVWDNPAPSTKFSFDDFRSSLLILFEIVSIEGWIDVMGVATSITGRGKQPQINASLGNSLFFLIYNLLGGVVILTIFVSVIIGNFSKETGTAFLTQPQREWIDLEKLLKRQKPSKRPKDPPEGSLKAWCCDRAVHKHGWWSRATTGLFVAHIFALMTQTYTTQFIVDGLRNDFFVAVTFLYVLDVVVRFYGLGWKSFKANGWNLFDVLIAGGSFITTLVVRLGTSGYAIQQLQKLFLVSIAFKLVQRTNSLNKLFKTAMASLPVILSLLGLWIILFVFFAILYVEVFSMTKWGGAETRNQNYSSIANALVMLAFMTTGEGWNQYMHDYALTYPRCTNSVFNQSESDCGSRVWSFALFIAWNLISMYIFVNMFTGVVVENFSFVFQVSGNTRFVTREEMRAYKKVWRQFANEKTGYLERHNFVPFFANLTGVFEIRIYPADYSVRNIKAVCSNGAQARPLDIEDFDIQKMATLLGEIDYKTIRKRRNVYCKIYHEASIIQRQNRGISFTDMLLLLAHHTLIQDGEALVLKDLVVRTETNRIVNDLVNFDRVRSMLRMITLRRRFLAERAALRAAQAEHEIPTIIVDLPETPPHWTRDVSSSPQNSPLGSPRSSMSPPYRSDSYFSPEISPAGAVLQRSKRASDSSMLSADLGHRVSRDPFASGEEDPEHVFEALQQSVWGDLIAEAAEENR